MVYTFARVSAVLELDVGDYFQVGRRMWFRFTEKDGRHHEMPAHHTLWSTTWRRIGRGSNLTRWSGFDCRAVRHAIVTLLDCQSAEEREAQELLRTLQVGWSVRKPGRRARQVTASTR